jgi:hypothetical protein
MRAPSLRGNLLRECKARILRAREELDEARKIAPNSYGHGYEAGCLDAYTAILDLLGEASPGEPLQEGVDER